MKKVFSIVIIFLLLCFSKSHIYADVFNFKADRMTGGKATGKERTILIGNARVQSDALIINADRIEIYGKDNRFVECTGHVNGEESKKQIYFKTDKLNYDRNTKIAIFQGNSNLEDKQNEVVARGRYIEYNQNTEIAVLQISVRLFKDNMVCRSEYAVYRRNEKLLDLSGFPVVYKEQDEFKADRIRVDLETDDVIMEGSVSGKIEESNSSSTEE